jgi:hypothetical protein
MKGLGELGRPSVALVALVVALGGTSYAMTGGFVSSIGRISGCVDKQTGALRVIKPTKGCHRTEVALSWNGPAGDTTLFNKLAASAHVAFATRAATATTASSPRQAALPAAT